MAQHRSPVACLTCYQPVLLGTVCNPGERKPRCGCVWCAGLVPCMGPGGRAMAPGPGEADRGPRWALAVPCSTTVNKVGRDHKTPSPSPIPNPNPNPNSKVGRGHARCALPHPKPVLAWAPAPPHAHAPPCVLVLCGWVWTWGGRRRPHGPAAAIGLLCCAMRMDESAPLAVVESAPGPRPSLDGQNDIRGYHN